MNGLKITRKELFAGLIIILLLISISSSGAMAAEEGYQGHRDGYYWTSLGHVGKYHFACGYLEALEVVGAQKCDLSSLSVVKGLEKSRLIREMDILYSNYDNKEIQLHVAFYIVAMRIKGAREEDVQRAILDARDDINRIVKIKVPASARRKR